MVVEVISPVVVQTCGTRTCVPDTPHCLEAPGIASPPNRELPHG